MAGARDLAGPCRGGAERAGEWRLELAFVALATLALSLAPVVVARWADIHVPPSFIAAVVIFVGATLFLGEVLDFYERFWWWDIAMHGTSAIGFGLIGFVLVFMMFQGDRYAAPPMALAFFAFCFAITIGTPGRSSSSRWISSSASTCRNRADGHDGRPDRQHGRRRWSGPRRALPISRGRRAAGWPR